MSFATPAWLLGLALVPLALLAYEASRRRGSRYAVRFTAVPALKMSAGTVPAASLSAGTAVKRTA